MKQLGKYALFRELKFILSHGNPIELTGLEIEIGLETLFICLQTGEITKEPKISEVLFELDLKCPPRLKT